MSERQSSSGGSRRRNSSSSRSRDFGAVNGNRKSVSRRLMEMILGVVIGLGLLIGLVWYFFLREPPDSSAAKKGDVTPSIIGASFDPIADFENIRNNGGLNDLQALLIELNNWPKGATLPVRIDYQNKRVAIANRILAHPEATEEQRVLAGKAKLDALGAYYGLDYMNQLSDPLIAEKYLKASSGFLDDPNYELSRDAYLGKAKTLIYEFSKGSWPGTFASVEDAILVLPEKFPDDSFVISNVQLLLTALRQSDMPKSMQLTKKIIQACQGMQDPQVLQLLRSMQDVVLLNEKGSALMLESSWDKTADQKPLLDNVLELCDRTETGETVLRQIETAINWFEKIGKVDYSIEICNRLAATANLRQPEAVAELAQEIAQNGLQRAKCLNSKWSFEANDERGRKLESKDFSDKVVLIAYWSPSSNQSNRMFDELNRLHSLLATANIKFVTVRIDDSPGFDAQSNPAWTNLRSTPGNPSPYVTQCPVTRVPYYVIIGRDGKAKALNVDFSELKTKADWFLSQKPEQTESN